MTIEIALARDGFLTEEDGKAIMNGTIDFASSTDEKNVERSKYYDFSDPLYDVSLNSLNVNS